VQSEQVVRQHPLRNPFLNIAEPREMQIAPPKEFQLPVVSGQETYDNRIKDQYDLMRVPGVAQWPKVGVRVPFEPMTFDDLKLDPRGKDKTAAEDDAAGVTPEEVTKGSSNRTATGDADVMEVESAAKDKRAVRVKDADDRDAFEVRSLAFPLISMSPKHFCDGGDLPSGDERPDDGGEFDDEGDNFHASYMECSFPGGRPPPTSPGVPADPDHPENATPAAPQIEGQTSETTVPTSTGT
jgi:hypothetical protein